jgi:hypothetical protein
MVDPSATLIARTFNANSRAKIHYDQAMADKGV